MPITSQENVMVGSDGVVILSSLYYMPITFVSPGFHIIYIYIYISICIYRYNHYTVKVRVISLNT